MMTENASIVLQAMKDFETAETNGERAAIVRFIAARLAAADAVVKAAKDGAKFVAKYVADTESVIGKRALTKMEVTIRQYEETR